MKDFKVYQNGEKTTGPFGGYEIGSVGAILNLLVRQEQIPLRIAEQVTVGENIVNYGNEVVSRFKVLEHETGSSVVFKHTLDWGVRNSPITFTDAEGVRRMKFHPHLRSGYGTACVEFAGKYATPELHRFLSYVLGCNRMDEKTYHLGKKAGHFFQVGYSDPHCKFFQIEFCGSPQAIKEWCDWCTANYRVGVDLDTYWEELFKANKVDETQDNSLPQPVVVLVPDIVEANGKTVKQNNLEIPHNIPIGSLVEITYKDSDEDDTFGLRLWVVGHTRDCDGTPLYAIGLKKNAFSKEKELKQKLDTNKFSTKVERALIVTNLNFVRGSFVNGYPEDCLKLIS